MSADTTVKFFHSAMTGAPQLNGTAGSLIAILDACLVNGFGLKSVDSLVVSGGVATLNISAGHSFEAGSVALVAGATPSGLNGEKKVISTTTTTATFDATGIADQTATGTITAKLSPLGWTKAFSGTNLAAYKPSDVTATGMYLRVDDTGTKVARVVGYETMTDVNTGTGAFPSAAQVAGGLYWAKSNTADAVTHPWVLSGDGRSFYVFPTYFASVARTTQYGFGDPVCTKSGDAYGCAIFGIPSDQSSSTPGNQSELCFADSTTTTNGVYMPRSYTGIGTSIAMRKSWPSIGGSTTAYSGIVTTIAYPNTPDGGLYVVPSYLTENAANVLRGTIPGLLFVPQAVNGAFNTKDIVTGVTGYAGRVFKAVMCGNSDTGAFFVDTTGPWR